MPKVIDDGKTYTLTLRKGLKYSNGEPVVASDFTHSLERVFVLNSSGSPFYDDIVGARRVREDEEGRHPRGRNRRQDRHRSRSTWTRPRGTFENELALPFVALLPAKTPDEDLSAEPAARHRPLHDHRLEAGPRLGIRTQPAVGEGERQADAADPLRPRRQDQDPGAAQPADRGQRRRKRHARLDGEPGAAGPLPGRPRPNTKAASSGSSRRSAPTSSG